MSVIIFSPSNKSLYSISVLALLARSGIEVDAVIVRRMFNWRLFVKEFRRYRGEFLRKIWKKLILRDHSQKHDSEIRKFLKKKSIVNRELNRLAKQLNVPVHYVWDLNDAQVEALLSQYAAKIVVFTGGGLIRSKILRLVNVGIINCHTGLLPQYRGMDVIEWGLLAEDFSDLGVTCHLMDSGVDTGPILETCKIDLSDVNNLEALEEKFASKMWPFVVNVTSRLLKGEYVISSQPKKAGRQFFTMHNRLKSLAVEKLLTHLRQK